jgi:hypothetical protein
MGRQYFPIGGRDLGAIGAWGEFGEFDRWKNRKES